MQPELPEVTDQHKSDLPQCLRCSWLIGPGRLGCWQPLLFRVAENI